MSALPIIITTAGLNALVNAQNTGTANVVIASLGVSSTQIAATAATSAIPNEFKRIAGVAGQVVAADQIYISAADQGDDAYAVRTIGLYLDNGVLFAVYSQAAPMLEKASAAMAVLEGAIKLSSPQANAIAFAGGGWLNPQASESVQGVLRLATEDETKAGLVSTRAVTPKTLAAALVTALNDRLGVGAPSAFMKGLLTTASAAAFRLVLGLKSAALRDEGAGNGLDADLLDGQHGAFYRAWANLTDVPASFPPTAHNHLWAEITGKPAAYPPAAHTHPLTDLAPFFRSGLETGLDLGNASLENQRSARLVAVNNGNNVISLSFRLSNGDAPVERALLQADGTLLLAGSRVWTAALFNPALKADLASPVLTGTPTAPTAAAGTNTLQIATTAFVGSALVTALQPKADLASPALTGVPTAPTAASGANTTQLATTAFVAAGLAPKADLASPALTGVPTAPTAAAGANTGQLATTAFVGSALVTALQPKADLASPALTGVPTAPTASPGANTTQLATTAFVAAGLAPKADLANPALTGVPTAPTAPTGANTGQLATTAFVAAGLAPKAPLVSPALTGTPTAPTAAAGSNSTQLATTAFVQAGLAPKADLASPALTGVPTAPTAAAGANTGQLATTAFVAAGLAPMAPLASPALTGTPTAPTAAAGSNSTQLATTAFVQAGLNLKVSKAGDKMTGLLEMPELRLKEAGTGITNSGATIRSKYYGDDQYGFSFLGNTIAGPAEVAVLDYTGALYLNGARTWTTALLTAASASEAASGAAVDRFITPAALWSFARSLGKPAYAVIPGTGLMIQCGSTTGNFPEGEAHTTLPVAFGGGCIAAVAITHNAGSNLASNYFMQVVSKNLDRIVFYANRSDSSSGNITGFDWVAIGLVSGAPDPAYSGGGTGGGGGGIGGGGEWVEP